jgi:hypothetical protein
MRRITLTLSAQTLAAGLASDRGVLGRVLKGADDADTQLINAGDHPIGTAGREVEDRLAQEYFADEVGAASFTLTASDAVKLAASLCHAVAKSGTFPHVTLVDRAAFELSAALKLAAVDYAATLRGAVA